MQRRLLLPAAYLMDHLAGDPEWFPHPVRLIGSAISAGESQLRRAGQTPVRTARAGGGALYLSRAGGKRNLVNREAMERIAAEHGLAVILPETLSLTDQIALFASAEMIAGEYGSALHNTIFAGAGAAVCALRGTARHPSLVQSGLATAMDQDVGYVFGGTEGREADQGFFVQERYFSLALELMRMRSNQHSVVRSEVALPLTTDG